MNFDSQFQRVCGFSKQKYFLREQLPIEKWLLISNEIGFKSTN